MRKRHLIAGSILFAACLPVVTRAQTVVFQENFDGGTGVGRFASVLAGGDGTFDANYNYGNFQYKLYPNYPADQTFTSQPIPPAPGGTSTTGLRISVDDTSGLQSNLQLLPQVAGSNLTVATNFKMSYDMWINYNGGNGGGDNSTEHMAAGLNIDGTGVPGFAPGGTRSHGYLLTSTGEGGNSGDYRVNTNDFVEGTSDDGPTYDKVSVNWTGTEEVDYDHVTGAYIGGTINPDEAQNSYFESLFPTGTAETPGAPGKQWVHVDIEQHGNAVEYSMNGHHVLTFFMSGPESGVPTLGFYDRNTGSAGADEPDQFMLYDNIVITQNAPTTTFTATSGNFSDPSKWSAGVPTGIGQDAVFDGAAGAASLSVSSPVTLRSLVFNSSNSYTVGGPGTISLSAETGDLISNAGAHTVTAPVNISGHTSVFNHSGSTLTLTHLTTNPAKFFGKTGAGTLEVNQVRAAGMTITDGFVRLLPNGGTSKVGTLVLGGSYAPTLDMTNDAMVIDYTLRADPTDPTLNNSPLLPVYGKLLAGYNSGDWNPTLGNSALILSSTAAAVAADSSNTHKTGIGFGEAGAILGPTGGTFNGEAVDGDAVLLKYTYLGDANLDGKVNALDFNVLATNFGSSNLPLWAQGDFNYDASVDTSDFMMMANNFGQQLASAPALGSVVPEPTAIAGLMAMGLTMLRRGRCSGQGKTKR
jgi:hypothetical protein